jgi:hypothetical protein
VAGLGWVGWVGWVGWAGWLLALVTGGGWGTRNEPAIGLAE